MDYDKYKKSLKKFRDKKNHDNGATTGLYAYEIKKLDQIKALEYIKCWFEIYFSFWGSIANKTKFLKDQQTLLFLKNRPKSEHENIFKLINTLSKNPKESKISYNKNSNHKNSKFFDSYQILMYCIVPAIGFPFLIWFSSFKMWVVSMFFALGMAYIDYKLTKNSDIKELEDDSNPLWIFSIVFAATIYWSAFLTDPGTFCSKQVYTSFTPTLTVESGKFTIKDKMSVRMGSGTRCDPGTVTPWMFAIFLLTSIWFFIKSMITISGYFYRRKK